MIFCTLVCLEGAKQFLDNNKNMEFRQDVVTDVVQGKRIIAAGEHKAGNFRFASKVSACCR